MVIHIFISNKILKIKSELGLSNKFLDKWPMNQKQNAVEKKYQKICSR